VEQHGAGRLHESIANITFGCVSARSIESFCRHPSCTIAKISPAASQELGHQPWADPVLPNQMCILVAWWISIRYVVLLLSPSASTGRCHRQSYRGVFRLHLLVEKHVHAYLPLLSHVIRELCRRRACSIATRCRTRRLSP
jgi:hypothetical protein